MGYRSLFLAENDLKFGVVYNKLMIFSMVLGNREINIADSLD